MSSKKLVMIAVALLLAGASVGGCDSGAEDPGERSTEERGSSAVEACRAHGGVIAFEDDVVICRDQTVPRRRDRGSSAVTACRGHGGVSAFDDDVVICGDQTFHEAEGG
jgi:hypothetical protein